MPPRKMTLAAIQKLIDDGIAAVLTGQAGVGNQNVGQAGAQAVNNNRFCTYKDFMDCKPTTFKGTEGTVGLTQCWELYLTVGTVKLKEGTARRLN